MVPVECKYRVQFSIRIVSSQADDFKQPIHKLYFILYYEEKKVKHIDSP